MQGNGKYGKNEKNGSHSSHTSHSSHNSHSAPSPAARLLPPRGDYHKLLSFQKAEIVYCAEDYHEFVETRPPEVVANIALCLIHQTNYLIDRQLRRPERDFVAQGGLRDRMTRARLQHRNTRDD